MHIDNILIHDLTGDKLTLSLHSILDTAVHLVIICQPCKKISPVHCFNFGGVMYNTCTTPALLIPENKVDWAIVMNHYLQHGFSFTISRLIISMVVSFLQYIFPITPWSGNIWASLFNRFTLISNNFTRIVHAAPNYTASLLWFSGLAVGLVYNGG